MQQGDLSLEDFVKKTRPLIERSDLESQNKVRQNILSIKNGNNKMPSKNEPSKIFDASTVSKRKKRMEKIERACKILDNKDQKVEVVPSNSIKHLFDNDIIRIVSRTSRALKD